VRDSALHWLSLSGVASRDAKVQTVALNQETGRARDAAVLIDSLPSSLSKDTLTVRQHFFTGELGKALAHTSANIVSWVMNPRERMLWQARGLIFSGRPYDAAPALDSLRFVPGWHAAAEVLRYKYWMQKLEDDQGMLDIWGRLELFIYIGDLAAAAELLRKLKLSGEAGEMLAVRLARPLAKAGRYQEALEVLELAGGGGLPDYGIKGIDRGEAQGKHVNTPEYLYFKAEMLHEIGRREEARGIAQRILKEFPGDIFAQKARILLMKI
jgi:tetratricopeptide (TPR) repeat protein